MLLLLIFCTCGQEEYRVGQHWSQICNDIATLPVQNLTIEYANQAEVGAH